MSTAVEADKCPAYPVAERPVPNASDKGRR